MLSDRASTIKNAMHPGELAQYERSEFLSSLNRTELGQAFAEAATAARRAGRNGGSRGRALNWLREPRLAAVLEEFRRRGLAIDEDRAAWLERAAAVRSLD